MNKSIKKLTIFFVVLTVSALATSCIEKPTRSIGQYAGLSPNSVVFESTEGFNFVQMHNDIVDRLNEEGTDIFYITGNTLDIDGDNEKKEIHLTFEVFPPTSDKEIELAISWMMKLIADDAAMQQFKYQAASTESFGTVWNDYSLVANVTRQQMQSNDGKLIVYPSYNKTIKAGAPIPFEPRAIIWGDDYVEEED